MRVDLVDPSAFTPPYDHALARALGRLGLDVRLLTSRFAYGPVPAPEAYRAEPIFYRHARGPAGSRRRAALKLAEHVPDMLRLRRVTRVADLVHFGWLTVPALDVHLLPDRPLVLTAHDLLPREPRPGQLAAQRRVLGRMDAVVVHSRYGRDRLVEAGIVPGDRVHVIPHGAFEPLACGPGAKPLPSELSDVPGEVPVVLCFGLIRPYKGVDVLLRAWRGLGDAELWIVGRPRGVDLASLRALAGPGVRFVPRFVPDAELPGLFARADVVVLPYARTERFDQSGVLATALGYGRPILATDIGGFGELGEVGAVEIVAPEDPEALREALARLLADPAARARLAEGARAAADGPYSWAAAAEATLRLYTTILGL